jgi:hypothetical protein
VFEHDSAQRLRLEWSVRFVEEWDFGDEIRRYGGGEQLCMFEEKLSFVAGELADFVEGRLEGAASLVAIGD